MKDVIEKLFGRTDFKLFWPTLGILLATIIYLVIDPKGAGDAFSGLYTWLIMHFSSGFLLGVGMVVFICFAIAFSKYGSLKLGSDDDEPEFSWFAWASMMFSASIGGAAIMWTAAEPLYHLMGSSWVVDEGTKGIAAGIPRAIQLTIFDWGVHGWSLFAIGGLAIAFPAYRKNKPMTVGTGLYGLLGDKANTGVWGKLSDILGAVSTIGGVATALGMIIMALAWAINHLFGVELGLGGKIGLLLFIIVCYIASAISGINRGIRILSLVNVYIALFMAAFLLIMGPTEWLLNLMTQSVGEYFGRFIEMTFWTDAGNFVDGEFKQRSWLNWWVVFYWLWWATYIPFCGGFLARISKGRTIREYLLGSIFAPLAILFVIFTIWGGNACYIEVTGQAQIWAEVQNNFGAGVYMVMEQFPGGTLLSYLFFLSVLFFAVTTADSASYFVSMQMSHGDTDPSIPMRALWGSIIGFLGVFFMAAGGGGASALNALKGLSIIVGTPFFLVEIAFIISIFKMLAKAHKGEM